MLSIAGVGPKKPTETNSINYEEEGRREGSTGMRPSPLLFFFCRKRSLMFVWGEALIFFGTCFVQKESYFV